jgi:hypothetical protein
MVKFAAYTRKMSFRSPPEDFGGCKTASDPAYAVKSKIPQGFKLLKFRMVEYLKNIITLTIFKI